MIVWFHFCRALLFLEKFSLNLSLSHIFIIQFYLIANSSLNVMLIYPSCVWIPFAFYAIMASKTLEKFRNLIEDYFLEIKFKVIIERKIERYSLETNMLFSQFHVKSKLGPLQTNCRTKTNLGLFRPCAETKTHGRGNRRVWCTRALPRTFWQPNL
jgi:hypothetical protein